MSYQDISATLDMPIGSIGPTRARVLAVLRREVLRRGITSVDSVCSRTGCFIRAQGWRRSKFLVQFASVPAENLCVS